MRLSFRCIFSVSVFALALAGCAPRDALFRGTSTYTITPRGGPAITGAEPQDTLVCSRTGRVATTVAIAFGSECALVGRWSQTRDGTGTIVLAPGQSCALSLAGKPTSFTVDHGSFHFSNGSRRAADGNIAGTTSDGGRYVSLQYASTESAPTFSAECTEVFRIAAH